MNYIRSWFFLDLVATFPFQLVELYVSAGAGARYNKLLRLLRLPRLYRLVRLLKCAKLMKAPSMKKCCQIFRISHTTKRLLLVAFMVVFFSHLAACLWYLTAKIDNQGELTWVARNDLIGAKVSLKYLRAMHWTLQTITTVGFGDVGGRTTAQLILSLFWMVFGAFIYSYTIGSFSSMIAEQEANAQSLQQRMDVVDKYFNQGKISETLTRRLQNKIELSAKRTQYLEMKVQFLEELPAALKIEVMKHLYGHIMERLDFFTDKKWDFSWMCLPMLEHKPRGRFELLFEEGDVSQECYFLTQGKLALCTPDARIFYTIIPREHIGDIELFTNAIRVNSCISLTRSELYVLSKGDFLDILEHFPRVAMELREEAADRELKIVQSRISMLRQNIIPPHPLIMEALAAHGEVMHDLTREINIPAFFALNVPARKLKRRNSACCQMKPLGEKRERRQRRCSFGVIEGVQSQNRVKQAHEEREAYGTEEPKIISMPVPEVTDRSELTTPKSQIDNTPSSRKIMDIEERMAKEEAATIAELEDFNESVKEMTASSYQLLQALGTLELGRVKEEEEMAKAVTEILNAQTAMQRELAF